MKRRIVIGLNYGDEGKGHVVDWLAGQTGPSDVVRYSGGHQAGHGVTRNGYHHVFSNLGSGTLKGSRTIWNAKTFDPLGTVRERDKLVSTTVIPKQMYVNPTCPVVTPFEIGLNKEPIYRLHGTVGVGFGLTLLREKSHYHLQVADMFHPEVFEQKLELIENFYGIDKVDLSDFLLAVDALVSQERITTEEPRLINPIYESSQGLMLDMDYGYFPHCTPSQVGTQNLNVTEEDQIFLVTRGYNTRHGAGPLKGPELYINRGAEQNLDTGSQGKFRTAPLNLDEMNYVLDKDKGIAKAGETSLVITCLDQMKDYWLISGGKEYRYPTENSFILGIIGGLRHQFEHIYLSHGPTFMDIEKFRWRNVWLHTN